MSQLSKNKYNKITDKQLIKAVKNNISIRSTLHYLNLCETGSAYRNIQRRIKNLNIDISHFLGRGYLRGKNHTWAPKQPLIEILVKNSSYSNIARLKIRLLKEKLLINQCYECKLKPLWNNKILVLQLDHVNGINNDHRIENLRLLCPNCHSQTDTFAGKNIGGQGGI